MPSRQGPGVLLYAQKLSATTALTAQHVQHEDGRTLLRLGSRPVILPAPLDDLVGYDGSYPVVRDYLAWHRAISWRSTAVMCSGASSAMK